MSTCMSCGSGGEEMLMGSVSMSCGAGGEEMLISSFDLVID